MPPASQPDRTVAVLAVSPLPIFLFDAAQRLTLVNLAGSAQLELGPAALPAGTSAADVLRLFAERGLLDAGEPATLAARLGALDPACCWQHRLQAPDGRQHELCSMPAHEGGRLLALIDAGTLPQADPGGLADLLRRTGALPHLPVDGPRTGRQPLPEVQRGAAPLDAVPETLPQGVLSFVAGGRATLADPAHRAMPGKVAAAVGEHRDAIAAGRVHLTAQLPAPRDAMTAPRDAMTAPRDAMTAPRDAMTAPREALLQTALDGMRHGIALFDRDRRLLVANAMTAGLVGLEPDSLWPGRPLAELIAEQAARGEFASAPEASAVAEGNLRPDHDRPHRWTRRRPDGTMLELISAPTRDGGFVVTYTDVTARACAEAEAEARAAMLRATLDSTRHAVVLYGPDHRLRAFNRLANPTVGLPELCGREGATFAELVEQQRRDGMLGPGAAGHAAVAAALALDRARPQRYPRRLPNGRSLEIASDPTPDGGFVVTFTDVTELAEAKAAAQERAAVLQAMLDATRHGIALYDANGRVVAANTLASVLAGHTPGFVTPGRHLYELIEDQIARDVIPGGRPAAAALAAKVRALDRSQPVRYVRPAQHDRFLELTSDPTPDGGFVITQSDVTPLVRAEAEATRRAGMLEVMLDTMRHGVCLFGPDNRVIAANAVILALLDIPPEALAPGQPIDTLVDFQLARGEFGPGEAGRSLAETIKRRDRSKPSHKVRSRDDGRMLQIVSDAAADGTWVLAVTDVTEDRRVRAELERAREAAEEANRAKSRFLATMSHELRTPLNAVIGFSEALLADPGSPRAPEFARPIRDAGRQLLSLIDDILDVARAETTGLPMQLTAVDLVALAAASVPLMERAATAAGVALELCASAAMPPVRADAVRVRQVLLHLLSNAVKFTPVGGRVTVAVAREPGGAVVLRVADTGIGLAAEDIPRAFEPFTQLDASLSRRFAGSGLGLYLSRALARAQGAELTLDSELGRGTTATLRFPQAAAASARPADTP